MVKVITTLASMLVSWVVFVPLTFLSLYFLSGLMPLRGIFQWCAVCFVSIIPALTALFFQICSVHRMLSYEEGDHTRGIRAPAEIGLYVFLFMLFLLWFIKPLVGGEDSWP